MKQQIIILIILFFLTGASFGQRFEHIEDSINLEKFNSYVNSVIVLKRDSIFPDSLPNQYKIIYMTSCPASEFSNAEGTFYHTNGKSFIKDSTSINPDKYSLKHPFLEPQNRPFICADNPSMPAGGDPVSVSKTSFFNKDSSEITNIYVDPFFEHKLSNGAISYMENKFLIIEFLFFGSNGNQISYGRTETYFLERIE